MAVAVGETPAAVEDHDQARKEYTMTGGPDGQPPRHRLAPGRISLKLALKRGVATCPIVTFLAWHARRPGLSP